jgi:hypothetical protein
MRRYGNSSNKIYICAQASVKRKADESRKEIIIILLERKNHTFLKTEENRSSSNGLRIELRENMANNFTPFTFTPSNLRLKYCCDLDKDVLSSNFEKRGWTNVNQEDDWNFYW